MMLRLFILPVIACTLCTNISFCQNKRIDSLLVVLKSQKEDTNKVNTLMALGWSYGSQNNYSEASKNFISASEIGEKLGDKSHAAASLSAAGLVFVEQGNYSEALKYLFAALNLREQLKDKKGMADCLLYIGYAYHLQENYSRALENLNEALRLSEELADKKSIAFSFQAIGEVYLYQGNKTEALKNYLSSLRVREEMGDKVGIGQSNISLGRLYSSISNYYEAVKRDSAALKIYQELGDRGPIWGIPGCYEGLGDIYDLQGDLDNSYGSTIKAEKEYSEALNFFSSAYSFWQKIGAKSTITQLAIKLGIVCIKLKKVSQAKAYLGRALELSKETGTVKQIRDTYYNLSNLEVIQGNYKQAYENYKSYILYRDRLINEENTRKSEGYKMQYDFDKKEDSLKQKQIITETKLQAQKKQRYYYWAGLALLAILSFFIFLTFRNQKKINRLAGESHSKEKAELELQSLRAQLNPHFMFNSLNAIQELILLEENEKSQSYLARFSKLLRMLLENAERPFIPLQREIDFLQLYLSLENLRIPDLHYTIISDPGIDTEQTAIPNMILQPYIENAIWHGLSHKPNDKMLQLRIKKTNGMVQYEIEDNGVGRKKAEELKSLFRKEHKSKGMELLSKRFKLLAKEYGSDIETDITDVMNNGEVAGTLVTIKVPWELSLTFKSQQS